MGRRVSIRLKVVLASVFIVVLLLGMAKSVPAAGAGESLIMAMEATGAQVEEASINAWIKLPNGQLDDEELVVIVQQVMKELDVGPVYNLAEQQIGKQQSIQAEAMGPDFHTRVVAKKMPSGLNTSEMECYLVITIENVEKKSLSHMQEAIRRISKKNGSSPHINTCLIGWLNGTLRDGEQQDLLQKAFKAIDGTIIDKLETGQLSSYTGFALGIMEWLQVGDQKINLNMAMRYSQYDDRTYVTIGSPIITREY